ncbi:hypothetical protein [Methylococcus sp. Mc7]|uniref:hypothetical protein n=1 Tax=Methylococcus sp. Mc7 TaxID=2860258 RepID=UPI00210814CC|nr:hypothetical protein [Methylococcus sp. Mc7]
MKTLRPFTIAGILGLLVACAPAREVRPHKWALAVQTAETREAHEALAKHYEEVAKQMQDDAEEEREMLAQYQAQPHKYGKRILDLKARAEAMIRDFELAAKESRQMAEYHRQLAKEASR